MTEKAVVNAGFVLTFENNINGEITESDKKELVYLEFYDGQETSHESFGYEDAIELRNFLDELIKKADRECKSND